MPELPEVEAARRFVNRVCAGLKISKITTTESGGGPRDGLFDSLVFVTDDGTSEASIQEAFMGRTLKCVCRKGKQLWMEFTDTGPVVMFHFGMTGAIVLKGHDVPLYFSSNSKDFSQWPPKFCKLLVEFSDGTALAFRDPRRLGRIKICSHAQLQQNISKLGIDPTAGALPSTSDFLSAMSDLTAPIKAVLLDQERIFCGIGNYLADEILYQARIHPSSPTNALREEHVRALLEAMQYVVSTAVEADADYRRFPPHWLFHSRWDKVKSKSQTVKLADGSIVVFEEVGGRTSAVVPSVQKKLTRGRITATTAAAAVTVKTSGTKKRRRSDEGSVPSEPVRADAVEVKVEEVVQGEVVLQSGVERVVRRRMVRTRTERPATTPPAPASAPASAQSKREVTAPQAATTDEKPEKLPKQRRSARSLH